MAAYFIPVEHYQSKLYQKDRDFKKFQNIAEDNLAEVARKVYKKQEGILSTAKYPMSKLEKYQRTLEYLTNPLIYSEIKTYDEKIIFLILSVDPNLTSYKEYLKLDIVSMDQINKTEDSQEKKELLEQRKQTLLDYEKKVRDLVGFYDPKLIKYEEAFFNKFYSEKELITEARNTNPENLIVRAKLLKNFDNISDERFEELKEIAKNWLAVVPEKNNLKTAIFSVLNQRKLLGLNNTYEQLALFILLADPNLDMLRIYEEENRMQDIETRIAEEFRYFNKELLTLEGKYHKRFCPDKDLSIWAYK